VHSEDLRVISDGELIHIEDIILKGAYIGNVVSFWLRKLVFISQNIFGYKEFQDAEETSAVPIISHSSSVVYMSDHEGEGVPRCVGLLIE